MTGKITVTFIQVQDTNVVHVIGILLQLKTEPYVLSRFISIKKEHCALLTNVITVVMTMVS